MRISVVAVLFLAPLFAGCVEEPADGDSALPDIGDPIGGLAGNATFRLEGCRDNFFPVEVPREWAEPFVAEGFRLRHPVVTLAHVSFKYCERVSNDTMVENDVHIMETSFDAMAEFEGAYDGPISLIVEVLTDSKVVQEAWGAFDRDAVNTTFTCSETDLPTAPHQDCLAAWAGGSISFSYLDTGLEQAHPRTVFELWWAGPPHVRLITRENATIGFLTDEQPVPFELEGESQTRNLFGGHDSWQGRRFPQWDVDVTYELTGGFGP